MKEVPANLADWWMQGKSHLVLEAWRRSVNIPLIIPVPLRESVAQLISLRERVSACWDFCPGSVKEVLVTRQLPRNQARRHVAKVLSRLPYQQVVRLNPKVAYRVVWQLM